MDVVDQRVATGRKTGRWKGMEIGQGDPGDADRGGIKQGGVRRDSRRGGVIGA